MKRWCHGVCVVLLATAGGCNADPELSEVPGVSILPAGSEYAGTLGEGGTGYDGYRCRFRKTSLPTVLISSIPEGEAIVLRADLPEGAYDVRVSAKTGGKERAAEMLAEAYTGAFDVTVRRRQMEIPVHVVTAPDPNALQPARSETGPSFWEPPPRREQKFTVRKIRFSSTIPRLARYLARQAREWWAMPVEGKPRGLVGLYLVDETGLEGHYRGAITFDAMDPGSILEALRSLGLEVTRQQRVVEAWVVE